MKNILEIHSFLKNYKIIKNRRPKPDTIHKSSFYDSYRDISKLTFL